MSKLGHHQSVDAAVGRRIARIQEKTFVKKIILGRSVGKSHGKPDGTLKFLRALPAGFSFIAYGQRGITECYLYCAPGDLEAAKALMDE